MQPLALRWEFKEVVNVDKALAIAQLISAIAPLADTEFEHIWNLVHAVKGGGVSAATINSPGITPEIPQLHK
jgi:hypothetical protein